MKFGNFRKKLLRSLDVVYFKWKYWRGTCREHFKLFSVFSFEIDASEGTKRYSAVHNYPDCDRAFLINIVHFDTDYLLPHKSLHWLLLTPHPHPPILLLLTHMTFITKTRELVSSRKVVRSPTKWHAKCCNYSYKSISYRKSVAAINSCSEKLTFTWDDVLHVAALNSCCHFWNTNRPTFSHQKLFNLQDTGGFVAYL